MNNLQHLTMDLIVCRHLTEITPIGHGLQVMNNLQQLKMDFAKCSQVTDITSIGAEV